MTLNDRERMRLVGDLHSHPGGARYSQADQVGWQHAAQELAQPFACLIRTAGEYWKAGKLRDDCSNPIITG